MSLSWQRLIEGKHIEEMDIILLRHELFEQELMLDKGLSYKQAHRDAEQKYNYKELAQLFACYGFCSEILLVYIAYISFL